MKDMIKSIVKQRLQADFMLSNVTSDVSSVLT